MLARLIFQGAACVAVAAMVSTSVTLAEDAYVVRVEEDWELVVQTPDPATVGPQVTCVISPNGHVNGCHATFELNHRTQPSFCKGGLQLQRWHSEKIEDAHHSCKHNIMRTEAEVVTWTQVMTYSSGVLTFEVVNGHSQTWGEFGGDGQLKSTSTDTEITTLANYSPATSVSHSGVGFAGNRVASLVLKRARLIMSDGQVLEDNTVRTVHTLN
jgi:hypothetical protein